MDPPNRPRNCKIESIIFSTKSSSTWTISIIVWSSKLWLNTPLSKIVYNYEYNHRKLPNFKNNFQNIENRSIQWIWELFDKINKNSNRGLMMTWRQRTKPNETLLTPFNDKFDLEMVKFHDRWVKKWKIFSVEKLWR